MKLGLLKSILTVRTGLKRENPTYFNYDIPDPVIMLHDQQANTILILKKMKQVILTA